MRKLPALDPEVQAVIDETMADWRRRNGRCPDPAGHERANANNDEVIRLKAEGRYMPVRAGWCDYCGFRLPS